MESELYSEENTLMVLRGATFEEAFALVENIDIDNMSILEISEKLDSILTKYGWTFRSLLEEIGNRRGTN